MSAEQEYAAGEVGATPGELASAPELLIDLATSLLNRRTRLADCLLHLIGGYAADKVASLRDDLKKKADDLSRITREHLFSNRLDLARETMWALARLENAVWTLLLARCKAGMRLVPTTPEVA